MRITLNGRALRAGMAKNLHTTRNSRGLRTRAAAPSPTTLPTPGYGASRPPDLPVRPPSNSTSSGDLSVDQPERVVGTVTK